MEGRELPARPLVLEAAGAQPNNPTNSHQAIAILDRLGFETRYVAVPEPANEPSKETSPKTTEESLPEAFGAIANAVPKGEWNRIPADLSKNVDQYLYSNKK